MLNRSVKTPLPHTAVVGSGACQKSLELAGKCSSAHDAPSASCRGKTPRERADHPGPQSGAAIGRKQICGVRSDGMSHVSSFRLAPGSFESKQAVSRCAQTEFGLTLVAHGAIADVEAGMNFS